MASPPRRTLDHSEDWSEIESLLVSPVPYWEGAAMRSRRHLVPIIASTVLSSVVFAAVVTAALGGGSGWTCALRLGGCVVPTVATASPVPASTPVPTTQTSRLADAGAAQPDPVASSPVVQGRSVSEAEPAAATPADPVPEPAAPRHRGRHHHHHRMP